MGTLSDKPEFRLNEYLLVKRGFSVLYLACLWIEVIEFFIKFFLLLKTLPLLQLYNLGMPSLSKNADPSCSDKMAEAISFGINSSFIVAILICLASLLSKWFSISLKVSNYFTLSFRLNKVCKQYLLWSIINCHLIHYNWD